MDMQYNSHFSALNACCLALRCAEKDDGGVEVSADFQFAATFVGFQGHFPGNPILPAIFQLAAVRFLLERSLGQTIRPKLYNKIKFKGMIRPDDALTITAVVRNGGETRAATFSLKRPGGETIASGLLEFTGISSENTRQNIE